MSLRLGISGGAALPVEVLRGFEQAFGTVDPGGLRAVRDLAGGHVQPPRPHRKPGSIGIPIAGVELKLVDPTGPTSPRARSARSPSAGHNVMKGYWRRPDASPAAIRDGWFHTGDMARRDDDGFYFIVDRKKDLIIRGGFNVYPREIEEVLYEHPAVLEAAVVGMPAPHPRRGGRRRGGAAARCHRHARGAARLRQGAGRGLQVPAPRVAGRRPAQGPDRQGPQARDRCLPTSSRRCGHDHRGADRRRRGLAGHAADRGRAGHRRGCCGPTCPP